MVIGVLQHPREARVSKGTGALLPLALRDAFIVRGIGLDEDPLLAAQIARFPAGSVGLLFPEQAVDIRQAPAALACLLVPDGTWSQARCILGASPRLGALPRYALPAGVQGSFPIRRPAGPGRVSTLEAVVAALRVLEGDPGAYQACLSLQAELVRVQVEQMRARDAHHPALGTGSWRPRKGGGTEV